MVLNETGHETINPDVLQIEERANTFTESKKFRDNLSQDILSRQPLPAFALDYFARNASDPSYIQTAIETTQRLLEDNPNALDDPEIAEFELQNCLNLAEAQSLERAIDTEDTKISNLKDQIRGNLTGDNKVGQLAELIVQVKADPNFPEAEKQAALLHLNQINETLSEMQVIFPNETQQTAFNQIINASSLDLSAPGMDAVFAPIIAEVEASNIFSEGDKRRLQMIITGSQAQDMLTRTVTDKSGRIVTAWPKDAPMEVRSGISMYADSNANQYLRAEYNGHITDIDMTGVSGETVGKYLEALSFVHDVESFGATGMFQSIYQIDFNLFGDEGFDMAKITQILNIMGKLFGGLEHADGDIRQDGDRQSLIRHFARLFNPQNSASGFGQDQQQTNKMLMEMELREPGGSPNWKQIERLGNFVQMSYLSGEAKHEDLKAFLVA